MKSITIDLPLRKHVYQVLFPATFAELEKNLKLRIGKRKFLIVTDINVQNFTRFLEHFSKENVLILPAGEQSKSWHTVEHILERCFQKKFDRDSVIVAIGGGVVGDTAGFAASVFMRGIPVIQIPTSLLAMVDASVGGKTGIDCAFGKNLIGTFHQPEAIFCCRAFLETLPESEIKNGLAEMIKHGILGSEKHFEDLERIANPHPTAAQVFPLVPDSIHIKEHIIEADERESGLRMKLNLGHTFGHAIELLHNFQFPHGLAVAIGTVMAAQYALEKKICSEETADRIENIFHQFGMDISCDLSEKKIWEAMQHDKKIRDGHILLVLPKKIGEVVVHKVQ